MSRLQVREIHRIRASAAATAAVRVLEVLSPTNKITAGRGEYLGPGTAADGARGPAHLLEIDLLRHGPHTRGPPQYRIQAHGAYDYLICLHRAGLARRYETWPFLVRHPMPRITVTPKNRRTRTGRSSSPSGCADASLRRRRLRRQLDYTASLPCRCP